MILEIPAFVTPVLEQLHRAGYEAYVVGGCVRDSLLHRTPQDWDVTTSALPEQVKQALPDFVCLDTGLAHGTVTVLSQTKRLEITTFRVDGAYSDHRRPDGVAFTGSLTEDLARRDFTINAMAYDPRDGLIDPFDGQADLAARVIRAVGDPLRRFEEDALRIMRGLRFAAVLGCSIDPDTAEAMKQTCGLLSHISPERLRDELTRLLCGTAAGGVLRQYREIPAVFLPELIPMFDFDQQNYHHVYDVWEHTLHALDSVAPSQEARLVMLLHDCGKPACFSVDYRGDGHFYGHAAKSAVLAREALNRLRFDRKTTDRVCRMIGLHDSDILPTEKSLRRWLRRIGEADLRLLLQIKIADNLAQNPKYYRADTFCKTRELLDRVMEEQSCFSLAQLAFSGKDLVSMGYRGPNVGSTLNWLLDAVIDGTLPNEHDALQDFVQTHSLVLHD